MGGPRTLGELAAAEQVRPATMSKLVTEMEAAGLVQRSSDRQDARVVRVGMTARGRRLLAKGRDMRIADVERRLRAQPPEDVELVSGALTVIERMLRD